MARIHRISKVKGGISIISPIGTITEVKLKDTKPDTMIATLNEHAVDVSEHDEFGIVAGSDAIIIATVIEGEIIAKTTRSGDDIERIQLPPIDPAELAKKAQEAIKLKESRKGNNKLKSLSPEFKSFLARVKYMIYMDDPRGSAPAIERKKIRWELRFWISDVDWYQVHRDDTIIYLTHFQNGAGVPEKATPNETLTIIKNLGWRG